jgi:hypothetical protein
MNVRATQYPLTVYFDGPFHNKTAEKFFKALNSEQGAWQIIHPAKGSLTLQLVSVKEAVSPVENGNYTEFETVWIEPALIQKFTSKASIADKIFQAAGALEDASIVAQQLRTDAYAAIQSAVNMYNQAVGIVQSIMNIGVSSNAIFKDAFESALSAYNSALAGFDYASPDITPVSEASIDLFSVPSEITTDYSIGFSLFDDLMEAINGTTFSDYNSAKVRELFIVITFINSTRVILNSEFTTRVEIITAIENLTAMYDAMIVSLEAMQEYFSDLPLEDQLYVSDQTYQDIYTLYADTLRYLFEQFYNLKAEKRFTLKNARSPIEITVTEYGSLGIGDEIYDLFIKSNNLTGNDILLLPAGREVVIYA